jgi:hypothetical protein
MMTVKFLTLLLSILVVSCARPVVPDTGPSVDVEEQANPAIGTIELVNKSIRRNEVEIEQFDQLFNNDSLLIRGGGEGILEMANQLRLRLFNTTRLGGITIDDLPDTPLFISIFLERGGFTGQFDNLEEGVLNFEMPGGARIQITGTTFFIVYDDVNGITTAGNFEGTMTIDSGGSGPLEIPAGSMRQAQDGAPPEPAIPIPFIQDEFEQRSRQLASPVEALNFEENVPTPELVLLQTPSPEPTVTFTPTQDEMEASSLQTTSPVQVRTTLPTSEPPTAVVNQNSFCRAGPSRVFEAEASFVTGTLLDLDGRLADGTWWRVKIPNSRASCWISANLLELRGDLDLVPILASPPTPTLTLTPTPSLTVTPTPTLTETPTPLLIETEPPAVIETEPPVVIEPEPVVTETTPDGPPPAPVLIAPENNAVLICSNSASRAVALSWNEVNDNDGISYYHLMVYSVDQAGNSLEQIYYGGVYATSIELNLGCDYDEGLRYRWAVNAVDGAGNEGQWAIAWNFTTLSVIVVK